MNTNDKNGRVHQDRSPEGIYKDENQLDLLKDTDLMLTDEKEWQEIQMTEDSLTKIPKHRVIIIKIMVKMLNFDFVTVPNCNLKQRYK